MNPFKFIASLALILVAAYVVFALWQSGSVPATIDIRSTANFKDVPATRCTIGDIDGRIRGSLYIFHDSARFDIISSNSLKTVNVHVISNKEDGAYFWEEGSHEGTRGEYGRIYDAIGLGAITQIVCRPWWIPYGGNFIVPTGISFTKTI